MPSPALCLLVSLTLITGPAAAQTAPPLDDGIRAAVIDDIARAITEHYVFPDVAEDVIADLRERAAEGDYGHADVASFSAALTRDLRRHDGHFRVGWNGRPQRVEVSVDQAGELAEESEARGFPPEMVARARRNNFGFPRAEILPGNIGYVEVTAFMPAAMAHDAATAAMNFVANTDAVIIDLRNNGGGDPEAVQYLCSWFFGDEPVHLNSLYFRPTDSTTEFWTLPELPGVRRPDVPLYVLTSRRTASAAEEFSYNMQTQERATLVGETTAGGANPGGPVQLVHGFEIFVSTGAAINPITGTNWEGTGVVPHVDVGADQALARAQMMAIDKLRADADAHTRAALDWTAEGLKAQLWPVTLGKERIANYVGHYGPRKLVAADGELLYSRDGGAPRRLIPISEDRFMLEGVDIVRFVIETDAGGKGIAIVGEYDNGTSDRSERTN